MSTILLGMPGAMAFTMLNELIARARVCAACRWPSFRPIDLLCEGCWQVLFGLQRDPVCFLDEQYHYTIRARFVWNHAISPFLEPAIYGLKGGFLRHASQRLVLEYSSHLQHLVRPSGFFFPPSVNPGVCHGQVLAESFSGLWQSPVCNVFAHVYKHKQKNQGREARLQRRFRLLEKAAGRQQTPVFIDDVLTTGGTARAAYLALGKPAGFQAWTWVYRPRLAQKSGV